MAETTEIGSPPGDAGEAAGSADGAALTPQRAAGLLFGNPRLPVDFEANDEAEARRAVEEFAFLFANAPGVFKEAFEGARAGAETLSGDRLQGLSEIIQNADDAGASFVEFQIADGRLIAVHDGRPVTLSDVLSLATPWLSNKTENVLATGRFGIGLMTLRALGDVLDVHSGPYHVRLGDPAISAVGSGGMPELPDPAATALCLPLRDDALSIGELAGWLGRWDDSALLFLRDVRRVTVLGSGGAAVRSLSLAWSEDGPATCMVAGEEVTVQRRRARAPDGRAWLVHSAEVPRPDGVARVRKASGGTVPLGLALPMQPGDRGVIYAGLPVVEARVPIRVNAQFDPVTSRAGLASTDWNSAMLPLLGDLWVEVVGDLFSELPVVAWDVVPFPGGGSNGEDRPPVVGLLEALLLDRARTELAGRAAIVVGGATLQLAELAVEDGRLESVLEPAEVASLAGLTATLPAAARDAAGRWRAVLDDWRAAGASLPPPVSVETALTLLNHVSRSPGATVSLTAAGLDAGLAAELAGLPCVVTAAAQHVVPPMAESLQGLIVTASPLAEKLGIGVRLAPEYLADIDDARSVLAWLREIGAVIDDTGEEEVVRRLAAAGQAGNQLAEALTDDQLRALRDAFEQMIPARRSELGSGVGLAITIDAFTHDSRGQVVRTHARPADVYMPRAIDKEPDSFAVAADKTPGLLWAHRRYAEELRSLLGRTAGLGPQKFLRLLGTETAPRVVLHPGLYQRYASAPQLGLGIRAGGSPPQRDLALLAIRATYTLNDLDSPDLLLVVRDIAKERKAARRRERAGALLGALGRGWDRLEDQAEVVAAQDSYGWHQRGIVRAFWLWAAGAIAWLDDTDGVAQAPLGLRLRTPGTIAVHGPDAPGYLRPEFDAANRRDVLAALGVTGEPSTRDLIGRLRGLRDIMPVPQSVATDAAVVYRALADRRATRALVPGDLSEHAIRAAFSEGTGLVHTDLGWRTPTQVLGGPAVFRGRRAFVPQVHGIEPLWTLLHVRRPSLEDCLRVISQVARSRRPPAGDDVIVILETLRLLGARIAATKDLSRSARRRLSALAVWTSHGWKTERPVYAVDDPALFDGLSAEVPVWEPGGELSQFAGLLAPLRITPVSADAATLVSPDAASHDADATGLLASAVSLLQDDLARNDPRAAGTLTVGWDRLREFEVRTDPDLRVRVEGLADRRAAEIDVATKADVTRDILVLRDSSLLRQVDGGGRAIAGLFATLDRRQLAQAWLAACVAAEDGRTAQHLELAEQQAAEAQARAEREMTERTAALARELGARHAGRPRRRPAKPAGAAPGRDTPGSGPQQASSPPPKLRVLVDPSTLNLASSQPGGRSGSGRPSRRTGRSTPPLPVPNRNAAPPRNRTAAPGFTSLDKESVGMELARLVLGAEASEIADLRAQHGVGADAIDTLDRFFELKVHLGDEPDAIHLEQSQIRRALSTPDFFLIVVSNIEGANARPKVRIIIDPVHQLTMTPSSSINYTGVRSAEHSLIFELEQIVDPD
ncbi:MAG TPA: hypothetical protein VMU94_16120 [Streptosporangiaceae bacterium]|nr:hypothetical protein [Streptosporangiaceae bacterium]